MTGLNDDWISTIFESLITTKEENKVIWFKSVNLLDWQRNMERNL